jgi:hypothetical protein
MKPTHKTFGEVTTTDKRITTGGNEVYDAIDKNKVARVLLADKRYWSETQ